MADEETIDREVIYVYETPDFSEQRAEELGIRKKMKEVVEAYMERRKFFIAETEQRALKNQKRGFFSNFLADFKDAMSSSSDPLHERALSAQLELRDKLWEFEQTQWLPVKYRNLTVNDADRQFCDYFFKDTVVPRTDMEESVLNEYYQAWVESYPPLFADAVKKANEETKNAHFFSVAEIENLCKTDKVQILNTKKFSAGQIFIKHPFMPHTYMNIETSESELFHIKMQCLSRIMQCLGASRVSGHAYLHESKRRQLDANGKISYNAVATDASVQASKNENYESDYVLEDTFAGDFSEESYNEALLEAKRVGLYEDFDIKNLLDQRNPQKQNKMAGRKVKIELTRELNESLDIAFGLQASGFNMNGAYKEILETQRKVMFELEIEF